MTTDAKAVEETKGNQGPDKPSDPDTAKPDTAKPDAPKKGKAPADVTDAVMNVAERVEAVARDVEGLKAKKDAETAAPPPPPALTPEPAPPSFFRRAVRVLASAMDD